MRFISACIIAISVAVGFAEAAPLSPIRFAGVWFYRTQNKQEVSEQFPVGRLYGDRREVSVHSVGVQTQQSDISKKIYTEMQKNKKAGGMRLMDRLSAGADEMIASRGDALVMACALNYEHTEVQRLPLGGKTISKVLAEIGFDLVLCNFHDRRIVAIYPLRAQIVDACNHVPTEAEKQKLLQHLYETKVVEMFLQAAGKEFDESQAPKTIGIGELTFLDKAVKDIPESIKKSINTYYSSCICSAFYEAAGIPVLPYSGGNELLYYTMREQVDDAASLDARTAEEDATAGEVTADGTRSFVLKKPDYTLDVVIPGYQTQVLAKKKYQRHLAFAAACRITLKAGEKTVYTSKYADSVQAMYTHDAKLGTPWIYYQAASYKMFMEASRKLSRQKQTSSILFSCSTK